MQILYNPVGSAGAYSVLIDTTQGGSIEKWNPRFSCHPQVEELASNVAGNGNVFTNVLGNIKCNFSMQKINTLYTNNAAAMAAAVTIANAFLTQLLNLQIIPDGAGAVPQYYSRCVFSDMTPDVEGASITWTMSFTSGFPTFIQPS